MPQISRDNSAARVGTPDRNVFILGAGFSADAGAPLVKDFLDTARELFDDPDSQLDEHETSEFKKVFSFREYAAKAREKFQIDLDNIEQLFGLIEMAHRLDEQTSDVRDAMVYVIAKTLQLATERQGRRNPQIEVSSLGGRAQGTWTARFRQQLTPGGRYSPSIYDHFAVLLTGAYDDPAKVVSRANAVITFNYDLVLDNALRRLQIEPAYGLENAHVLGGVDENAEKIPLLKLHGSTNWAICSSCHKVHVLQGVKFTVNPRELRDRLCIGCGKAHLRLLLVPPSWDKSEYRKAMQSVWKEAVNVLKSAKRICIIGYSMPEADAFFKFLLTLGLADNHQLFRFIVVDSVGAGFLQDGMSTIEKRYRDILERVFESRRFRFFGGGFAQFLQAEACTALGRAESISTPRIF